MIRRRTSKSPIAEATARSRGPLFAVGLFSGVVNILGLTGSFYMLQVYDRVLASRSVATLVALSVLALALFALQGVLEIIRSQVLSRVGARIERDLLKPVHDLLMRLPMAGRSPVEATQPVRDMEAVRNFMSGQAPIAFMDLPWMPVYLGCIFLLHPWLGVLSVGGMAVLIGLTLLSEGRLKEPSREATLANARRQQAADTTRRNFEVLRAMGFEGRAAARFYSASGAFFTANQKMSDVVATLGGISRIIRMMLQSAILGLGAFLVLKGQMSAGAIIASSILSGRAMAPVEMAIGNWKQFVAARQARSRLQEMIALLGEEPELVDLPPASQMVQVESVAIGPPGSRMPILRNVSFTLKAGDGLAVLGPSGAGKSTLARALVGAWPTLSGSVRLDGAPLEQWPPARIGKLIGYLPQDVELFDGTIAENIARLDPDADDAMIVAAAQAANVHDMILRLPHGYSTMLGEGGQNLSIGQRQRIGLARALYGDPFLVVLDEPNAHLDQEGEVALSRAIAHIRARKGIIIAVSHRRGILESVNMVAVVADGELKAIGPRNEVLKKLAEGAAPAKGAGAPAPAPVPPRPQPAMHPGNTPGPMQTGAILSGRLGAQGGATRSAAPPPRPATAPTPEPDLLTEETPGRQAS
ncbi:MAG: ATP-binding cassette subfamily C [Beijerinckiaceae bacterium]|nr:MAG: ATP-binding cassette subfamily C [Beijerinckiaceae bacterium]